MKSALLATLLFFVALPALAAELSVTAPGTVAAGDIVTARVLVNAAGTAINNAEATLVFPTDMLRVVSVSKSNSIFTLWVEEPAFSNSAGTLSFNGGVPTPGYSGSAGTVVTVTFEARRAGAATLSFSGAAVRANDGKGTDVLTAARGAQITVTAAPTPASPAPSAVPGQTGTAPEPLVVASPTHPSPDAWYAADNVRVRWELPQGATSVQTGMSREAADLPTVTYTPPITEKLIENLEDGTWYFRVRYRKSGVWSPISTYRVNIDSTVVPTPVLEPETPAAAPTALSEQKFITVGSASVTLMQAFMAMFVLTVLSMLAAFSAMLRLYHYQHTGAAALPRVRRDLHRGFKMYRKELIKCLENLDLEHKDRKLTREEQALYRRMSDNLKDLEKYLDVELDELE